MYTYMCVYVYYGTHTCTCTCMNTCVHVSFQLVHGHAVDTIYINFVAHASRTDALTLAKLLTQASADCV